MDWENAEDHPTSYSDFNYPIEEQVISAQLGLSPRSVKCLNPNLADVLGNYNLYRLKWSARLEAEGCGYFKEPFFFLFRRLCSEPEDSVWLTLGVKIAVKILLKLCISNWNEDQYENGAIVFLIATSGNQPYNVRLLHLSFMETGVKNAAWYKAEK